MKKTILITGASAGMGKETARKLLGQGHRVYATARRLEPMQDLAALGATTLRMDVTVPEQVAEVVEAIIREEGRIDVLWNNAGYGLYGAVEDVPLEAARQQFEVNLFGLASVTNQVIPHMRKAGGGTIINTSSMGGKIYMPMGAWYHASKHALEGWSDSLRLDLKPFNIQVVVLEPGVIVTEWGGIMMENMKKYSGEGLYAKMAAKVAAATSRMYENGDGSSPSVIADTVARIISARRPATRYRVGAFAKPMVWMRTFLGDRIFDRMIMMQLK
jgi:NAD(P)-dependent dehydrogenase (short-subunit alcohol dehydrogenase family)